MTAQTTTQDTDTDPCSGCGRADVIDGAEPAAHWNTPTGARIVAWSCSDECAETVEARRAPSGVLR